MRVGGFKEILKNPRIWTLTCSVFTTQNSHKANKVYEYFVEKHKKKLKTMENKQADKMIDFLCAVHLRDELSLKSGRYDNLSWMFKTTKLGIFVTRAWIDAIQQDLNISLIPKKLLEIPLKNDMRYVLETIHYIHLATYNIINYKGLVPSYGLIFRNIIQTDSEIPLKGWISKSPFFELEQVKIQNVLNIRCCSIKPHGCENYDLEIKENRVFVLARGMDEAGFNQFECVMPTILYTLHPNSRSRFKSTAPMDQVITISGEDLHRFFFLYELSSLPSI